MISGFALKPDRLAMEVNLAQLRALYARMGRSSDPRFLVPSPKKGAGEGAISCLYLTPIWTNSTEDAQRVAHKPTVPLLVFFDAEK
eukprot:12314575-Heterocapsa_arctica.AAC.1